MDDKTLTTNQKKKRVIDDYDDIAREYTEEFFTNTQDEKYIDQFLESLEGLKVLDVGCGNGRDCKYIFQQEFHVRGIDLSKNMLSIAQELVPDVQFEIMDLTNITYPENSYDGIISNCSLFHVPAEELPKTLDSFSKVLKPNGKLLLILQEGLGETMIEEPYRKGVYIYMNYFSVQQLENILAKHSFEIDNIWKKEISGQSELGSKKIIVLSQNKKG
jgi:putative phosphoethanolamine N-methyltransferase 2